MRYPKGQACIAYNRTEIKALRVAARASLEKLLISVGKYMGVRFRVWGLGFKVYGIYCLQTALGLLAVWGLIKVLTVPCIENLLNGGVGARIDPLKVYVTPQGVHVSQFR